MDCKTRTGQWSLAWQQDKTWTTKDRLFGAYYGQERTEWTTQHGIWTVLLRTTKHGAGGPWRTTQHWLTNYTEHGLSPYYIRNRSWAPWRSTGQQCARVRWSWGTTGDIVGGSWVSRLHMYRLASSRGHLLGRRVLVLWISTDSPWGEDSWSIWSLDYNGHTLVGGSSYRSASRSPDSSSSWK